MRTGARKPVLVCEDPGSTVTSSFLLLAVAVTHRHYQRLSLLASVDL